MGFFWVINTKIHYQIALATHTPLTITEMAKKQRNVQSEVGGGAKRKTNQVTEETP